MEEGEDESVWWRNQRTRLDVAIATNAIGVARRNLVGQLAAALALGALRLRLGLDRRDVLVNALDIGRLLGRTTLRNALCIFAHEKK